MIRPYTSADKEELLRVFALNTPQFFDKKEVQDFEAYLQENASTYLTIEVDNRIVGGIGYYVNKNDKSGRITWIFFDPDYAGRGLGKQAVQYCLEELNNHNTVEKFVVTTSQHAYQFFEIFGFNTYRIEKNYWGEGLDLYEMEKPK